MCECKGFRNMMRNRERERERTINRKFVMTRNNTWLSQMIPIIIPCVVVFRISAIFPQSIWRILVLFFSCVQRSIHFRLSWCVSFCWFFSFALLQTQHLSCTAIYIHIFRVNWLEIFTQACIRLSILITIIGQGM